RQNDLQEVALVVAYGVARLDQSFSFPAEENAVTGFFDVGEKKGLLVVTGDAYGERARLAGGTGAKLESGKRRRLPVGDKFAEVAGVGVLESFCFCAFDFAGAQYFDGGTA